MIAFMGMMLGGMLVGLVAGVVIVVAADRRDVQCERERLERARIASEERDPELEGLIRRLADEPGRTKPESEHGTGA